MKWFYIISVLLVALLTASPFLLLERPSQEAYRGQVVSYNVYEAKIKSIDPATCNDTTSSGVQGFIYEALYDYHYLKRPVELITRLADAMPEISADGLTYTIRLKKGLRYSRNACFGVDQEGRPLTREVRAEDFVTAFKRIADYHITSATFAEVEDTIQGLAEYHKATQPYGQGDFSRYRKENISGIQAMDDYTLRLQLNRPMPQLVYILAKDNYAPIPMEVVDYYLATRADGKGGRESIPMRERSPEIQDRPAVVGTGPYVLTEFTRGGRIILERNKEFRDEYYPSEGAPGDAEAGLLEDAGKKIPFIDVRYLSLVEEENPAWMLFLTKQRDTVSSIPRDAFASVVSPTSELEERWKHQGIRLVKYTYPAIYFIGFNMDDPVVGRSKSLRQAMCLAFDVESYIDVIFNGRGIRAVAPAPRDFAGVPEAGPSPYARTDLAAAKDKMTLARQELIAAGVIAEGEDIPELSLDLPGTDERFRRIGEFARGEFSKLGLRVKINMSDWPTFQSRMHNAQCQMFTVGGAATIPDADDFLQSFYSRNIERGTNDNRYRNPQYDKLYEESTLTPDPKKRTELFSQMIRIVDEDCPVLLLDEPVVFALAYDWVHDFKPHPLAYGMGKYTRIDVEARRKEGGP